MTLPEERGVRWRVHGRVQGVAFRWFTRQRAVELGISGWVRNADDGSVEIEAHGERDALERFKSMLSHGPSAARVERIDERELAEAKSGGTFRIAH